VVNRLIDDQGSILDCPCDRPESRIENPKSRIPVLHRACLPATVLVGLLVSLTASGQDAVGPTSKSDGAAAGKLDETASSEPDHGRKSDEKATSDTAPEFVRKTDAEWRRILTKVQYSVTRQKYTEPPFSGRYASDHSRGTFLCVCCLRAGFDTELFSSQHKFDSGTGRPSFYRPVGQRAVQTAWDYAGSEPRVEVMCRRCGAHLGHVFDDGPDPTGLRYCINSSAIHLKPPKGDADARQPATKTTAKSKKARAKVRPKPKSAPKTTSPAAEPQDGSSAPDSDRSVGSDQQPAGLRPRAHET